MIELFCHCLAWCFILLFAFVNKLWCSYLAMAYMTVCTLFVAPLKSKAEGRWIQVTPHAIVLLSIYGAWYSGNQQLAKYVYYVYAATIIVQSELSL